MELSHIRYFLAIVEHRSFGRAAVSCGVSQPSVSKALRTLERTIGQPLVVRTKPLRLTPAAERLRPLFEELCATADRIAHVATTLEQHPHRPRGADHRV